MKKEIDIWQFVRIMVESETNTDGKILIDNFGAEWAEIDRKLTELGESEPEKYADMMMHQNIVLDITDEINNAMASIISSVIEKLTTSLDELDGETDELAQDLAWEIQSLEQLVDELTG